MRTSYAASLSAELLTTKGNAQPSRGLAEPMNGNRPTVMPFDTGAMIRPVPPLHPPVRDPLMTSRITLRMDDQLRLRLRLASAHLGQTRQVVVLDALDHYLRKVLPAYLHERCPCIEGGKDGTGACCREDDT